MRIAICGASGFVGTQLSRFFVQDGYEVVMITRECLRDTANLVRSLDGCEVIINLSGASIIKRWSEAYKKELYASRIETTAKLVDALPLLHKKPTTFISASAVGLYKENLTHGENSEHYETGYLAHLVRDWEKEALRAETSGLRVVMLRMGVVLGVGGGIIEEIKFAFKIGLGGIPGNGAQPFSWVHMDDVLNIYKRAIENPTMSGVYNLVSPEVTTMKTFMITFGKIINRKAWLHIPEAMIKLKYGEGSEALLKGSFVIPKKLKEEGYKFSYDNLGKALKSILDA